MEDRLEALPFPCLFCQLRARCGWPEYPGGGWAVLQHSASLQPDLAILYFLYFCIFCIAFGYDLGGQNQRKPKVFHGLAGESVDSTMVLAAKP